jgi:hypothetical protein
MGLGLIRKALIVMTGGLAGYVWKDNSKQQRTAKAAGKRASSQKQGPATAPKRKSTRAKKQPSARAAASASGTAKELERLARLHGQGALSDAEFAAAKGKILGTSSTPEGSSKDAEPYPAVEANVAAARRLADMAGRDRASLASISHD